ncbi:hypothetical protein VWZ63_02375, partial [Phaeobacter sp. JH207A]
MIRIFVSLALALWSATAVLADIRVDVRDLFAADLETLDFARVKIEVDRMIDPTIDVETQLAQIDQMVTTIVSMLPPDADSWAKVEVLRRYIYQPGPWNGGNAFSYDHDDPYGNVPYNPGGSTSTGYHNQDTNDEYYTSHTDHSHQDYETFNYSSDPGASYSTSTNSYGVSTTTVTHSDGSSITPGHNFGTSIYTGSNMRGGVNAAPVVIDHAQNYALSSSGQAMNADGALYGIATLPAGAGLSFGKGVFGLTTRTAPVARSLSAVATPTALQTGGRTLSARTAKALNEKFGT